MSHSLSKRIIISPAQLQRLLGRDRELTNRTDVARTTALQSAAKDAADIGPSQAYARYREMQQRHLAQAASERGAPLELVVSDPERSKHPHENIANPPEEAEPPEVSARPRKPSVKKKRATVRKGAEKIVEEISGETPQRSKVAARRVIVHDPRHSPIKPHSPMKTRARQNNASHSWLHYGVN